MPTESPAADVPSPAFGRPPGISAVHEVEVPGGALRVDVREGATEPVLAVHGISSQRRLWSWLLAEMPELSLVAPDLRGRGDSIGVAGPSSVVRHAEDLVLVLDALGLDRVQVVGMSMGGFVAVELAARHPDRVRGLVLVDGGFPTPPPGGLTPDTLPQAFADRLARTERRWESLDDYVDFLVSATMPLLDRHDPVLRHYAEHDLAPDGSVRLSAGAVVSDAAGVYFAPGSWEQVTAPMRFLRAEWSIGTGTPPMYPDDLAERYAARCVASRLLPGADHAATIMSRQGAVATADLVSEALG